MLLALVSLQGSLEYKHAFLNESPTPITGDFLSGNLDSNLVAESIVFFVKTNLTVSWFHDSVLIGSLVINISSLKQSID